MKKLISIAVVAFAALLSGCATTTPPTGSTSTPAPNPVVQAAFALTTLYSTAQDAIIAYSNFPRCTVSAPPCADSARIVQLKQLENQAYNDMQAVQNVARSPDVGPNLQTLLNVAQQSMNALTANTNTLPVTQ